MVQSVSVTSADGMPCLEATLRVSERSQSMDCVDMNIKKFPIDYWTRQQNRRGKRSVLCIISNRWLRFGKPSQQPIKLGTPIWLDVMTENEDENGGVKSKKLCSLCVTVEQLQKLLDEVSPTSATRGS